LILIFPFKTSIPEDNGIPPVFLEVEIILKANEQNPGKVHEAVKETHRERIAPSPASNAVPLQDQPSVDEPFFGETTEGEENDQRDSAPAPRPEGARPVEPMDTLLRVTPVFPLASRRRGEEGEVRVLAEIGRGGHVTDASILVSSGYAALDESALSAVCKWLFTPGSPERLVVPVIFRLE
jgi:TonB family protein